MNAEVVGLIFVIVVNMVALLWGASRMGGTVDVLTAAITDVRKAFDELRQTIALLSKNIAELDRMMVRLTEKVDNHEKMLSHLNGRVDIWSSQMIKNHPEMDRRRKEADV